MKRSLSRSWNLRGNNSELLKAYHWMQLQFSKNLTQIVAQTWRFKNGSKKTITSKTQKEKKKKDQERHGRHGIKKEERRKDKGYERIHNLRAYEIFPKADCSLKLAQLALRFRHIKTTTTGQVNDAPERSGHSSKDLDSALPSKTPSESWFIWCYEMLRVDSSRFSRFRLRLQQACKRQNCCANPLSGLDWRLLVKRYDRCDCVLQVNRLCKLRRCCHKDVSKRRIFFSKSCAREAICAIACLKHRRKLPPSTDSILGGPEHICLACWTNKARIQLCTFSCFQSTTPSFEILLENMESGRKWQNLKSEDGWAPNMDKQW